MAVSRRSPESPPPASAAVTANLRRLPRVSSVGAPVAPASGSLAPPRRPSDRTDHVLPHQWLLGACLPLAYRARRPDNAAPRWHHRTRTHGGATQSMVRSGGELDDRAGGVCPGGWAVHSARAQSGAPSWPYETSWSRVSA